MGSVTNAVRLNRARWLAALLLLLPLAGYAQVPGTIDYRGYLTNDAGEPITGTVSVTFSIYDAVTAGNLLWEETQNNITVNAGRFDAVLGSDNGNSLQDDPDIEGFDRSLYLGLAVNGGAQMTPRLPLPGSAFAFAAAPTRGRIRVNCPGESIGQALARAPAGGRYVIEVSGDCNENITITRDRTTLRGIGNIGDARILGAYPSAATSGYAVVIAGARRVEFDALVIGRGVVTAEPGPSGILSSDNASFSLRNGTVVRDFSGVGIQLSEKSSLSIRDSTVTANGDYGVAIVSGSFAEGVNATVSNNASDGFTVHNNSSLVLRDSTVSGNDRRGVSVSLGSSLALDGNTTVQSSVGSSSNNDGAAIGLFDRGVLRASGGGNRIVNTVPAVYAEDPDADGGGFALKVHRNSSVRIDRGTTDIDGWVHAYNLSTLDIQDTPINGHLRVGGFNANMLFDEGSSSVLNGNVRIDGGGTFVPRTNVLINGFIDCRGGDFGPAADFGDIDDGYINCTGETTDLGVTLGGSADPVSVGSPVTYTATLNNFSSDPYVQATNVILQIDFDAFEGTPYHVGTITPSQGSCGDPGSGSLSGTTSIDCDLGAVGPDPVTVTVELTSEAANTQLFVSADLSMSNPDSDPSDNFDFISTTVTP